MRDSKLTDWLSVYEASKILRWMLGQTPQHPNKTKLRTQNNWVLRNARRLTTDSGVLSWINDVQDADPGYLYLHHKKMQANWHQYMECTSMRAGTKQQGLAGDLEELNSLPVSTQLNLTDFFQYKAI